MYMYNQNIFNMIFSRNNEPEQYRIRRKPSVFKGVLDA